MVDPGAGAIGVGASILAGGSYLGLAALAARVKKIEDALALEPSVFADIQSKLTQATGSLDNLQSLIVELQSRASQLQQEFSQVMGLPPEVATLITEFSTISGQIAQLQSQIQQAQSQLQGLPQLSNRISSLDTNLAHVVSALKTVGSDLASGAVAILPSERNFGAKVLAAAQILQGL